VTEEPSVPEKPSVRRKATALVAGIVVPELVVSGFIVQRSAAAPSKTIRATLPTARYIVRTGTDAKSGRVPYRLTLKHG
jgi:hypothetical protein